MTAEEGARFWEGARVTAEQQVAEAQAAYDSAALAHIAVVNRP
jgi:hypothetical protein